MRLGDHRVPKSTVAGAKLQTTVEDVIQCSAEPLTGYDIGKRKTTGKEWWNDGN